MKTNKIIIILLIMVCMISCETPYRITTRINPDGTAYREIYTKGSHAFMEGNSDESPYPFNVDDSRWVLTRLDMALEYYSFGEEMEFNVKISSNIDDINRFNDNIETQKWEDNLFKPQEKFKKTNKWFYTYYTYTCTYPEIVAKGPVPLSDYITLDEQKLLFYGGFDEYAHMNGIELGTRLEDIQDRFLKWFVRTQYEISYDVILQNINLPGDKKYDRDLVSIKDTLFILSKPDVDTEFNPKAIAQLFDKYFDTTDFTTFRNQYADKLDKEYEYRVRSIELFGYILNVELEMPGKIISTNAVMQEEGNLMWKVTAYRILTNDYRLTATSRTLNIWTTAITILIILTAVVTFILIRRNRKK